MSKTVPWSAKDISFDARALARDTAQRTGGTVGDWLDALIADHSPEALPTRQKADVLPQARSSRSSGMKKAEVTPVSVSTLEPAFELAATGTDGPLRRFAPGERQIVHVFDAAPEARSAAPQLMSEPRLTEAPGPSSQSARQPANPQQPLTPAPKADEDGRMKEQLIRDAVAAITRRQADLEAGMPPRANLPPLPELSSDGTMVGEIGAAISALETRLASARADRAEGRTPATVRPGTPIPVGLDDEASQAFTTLGRDLRKAVQDIDLRVRPNAAARGEAKGDGPARPDERSRGTQELLSTTARMPPPPNPAPEQPLPPRDTSGAPKVVTAARSDPDGLLGDVRALLERLGPGSSIDSLDRRMHDLVGKMERHLEAPSSSALIEDLSRRLDALQSVNVPTAGSQAFEQLLHGIEERVGKTRTASADIAHIEKMMNSLANRIEDARLRPDAKALSALEAQIEKLGERLERSEANLSSLDGVEHSLRELFSQLEHTRHATIDAAENAARIAARDTLRAAMQNPALAASTDLRSDLADKVAQEMQDLRLQHDTSERRTQAALASLHHAVARLVERLEQPTGLETLTNDIPAAPPLGSRTDQQTSAPIVVAGEGPDGGRTDQRTLASSPPSSLADGLIEPNDGRGADRSQASKAETAEPATGRIRFSGFSAPAAPADGSAPFIAAARRAAQAAQASAVSKQKAGQARDSSDLSSPHAVSSAMGLIDRTRTYLSDRRRPILLSLASLVVVLGALEVTRIQLETPPTASIATLEGPKTDDVVEIPAATTPAKTTASLSDAPSSAQVQSPASEKVGASALNPAPSSIEPAAPAVPSQATDSDPVKPNPVPKLTNPFLANVAPPSTGLSEGLKALALAGDPAAEYEVGLRYVEGRTVNRDPKTAAGWFEKAAAHGLAPAQYRLGSAYEKGVGEPRDPAQAVALYGRAADAGNMRAMHNLAVMSAEGAVGKPDYVKAATLFSKAAALGVRDSQFNLAILYARGLGIEQNLSQSYTWFAIAAAQGDDDAAKKRDDVAARLDAKTLQAAKTAAETFRPAPYVKSANDVLPPAGGWDAVAVPFHAEVSGQKPGAAGKASVM